MSNLPMPANGNMRLSLRKFTMALISSFIFQESPKRVKCFCRVGRGRPLSLDEVYKNSDAVLGASPTPGMGNKHGSFATIIGNIVHDNPGGGIMAQDGARQGKYGVDRPTHPTISNNVIFDNGSKKPGISCRNTGSLETPIRITGNYVYRVTSVGIGVSKNSVGIIEDNMVMHSKYPDITINDSTALKLNRNKVLGLGDTPGITIVNKSVVHEMIGNSVENGESLRFKVGGSSEVKEAGERKE